MAFRDEHEAALQRAAALERDREQAERDKRRAERELARARRERDDLAAELDEARRELAERGGAPILPGDRAEKAAVRGRAAALGFVAIMAVAVIGPALCHSSRSTAPPPPIDVSPVGVPELGCVLITEPAGATVVFDGQSTPIGQTPVQVLPSLWYRAGGLELRLPGYQSVAVEPPPDSTDCNRTFVLRPAP